MSDYRREIDCYLQQRAYAARLLEHPDVKFGRMDPPPSRLSQPLPPKTHPASLPKLGPAPPKPPRSYGLDVDWSSLMLREDRAAGSLLVGTGRAIYPRLLPYVLARCNVMK